MARPRRTCITTRWRIVLTSRGCCSTAHPAKFNEIVEPLIGREIEVPPALAHLLRLPRHEERLAPTLDALRAWL